MIGKHIMEGTQGDTDYEEKILQSFHAGLEEFLTAKKVLLVGGKLAVTTTGEECVEADVSFQKFQNVRTNALNLLIEQGSVRKFATIVLDTSKLPIHSPDSLEYFFEDIVRMLAHGAHLHIVLSPDSRAQST